MNVHSVSLKGRREQNEDKHNIVLNLTKKVKTLNNINFFGVYDGHGGKFVSTYLALEMPKYFMDPSFTYPLNKKKIRQLYINIQNDLRTKYFNMANACGSTCLIATHFKHNNNFYLNILNTGDSRCIISKNNIATVITKDHKPNWPEERLRIENLGGKIYKDGYDYRIQDLSVSRAFGDIDAEPYLTNMPEMFTYKLDNLDQFVVLACDGLWDVLNNQEVVNFIVNNCFNKDGTRIDLYDKDNKKINIARKLGEYAIKKGTGDNVTIIIIFFK